MNLYKFFKIQIQFKVLKNVLINNNLKNFKKILLKYKI